MEEQFARAVFTYEDLDDHLRLRPRESYWSRVAFLARLKREGRVVRIRRGLFCLAPPGRRIEEIEIDALLVASRLTADAVISHGSALECLGLAPRTTGEAVYSAGRPLNPLVFRDTLYRGVKFPTSLVRDGLQRLEVKIVERHGARLPVTSAERALVDLIDRPDLAGGWDRTVKLLGLVTKLDLEAVVAYTRALGNSTTAAKVGWYLTGRREAFGDSERHLVELSALKPNQPHYLDRSRRRDGRLVPDWNLIVSRG
jgi:predicted transcriptional regulator of viral defense system